MPIKVVKVRKDEMLSYVSDMSRRGFKCVELDSGEYSCSKSINEIQEYIVVVLSSPSPNRSVT